MIAQTEPAEAVRARLMAAPHDFFHVVLQPTARCNLNCAYCYLPDRRNGPEMAEPVAEAVARSIDDVSHAISVLWHGGEPLACGVETMRRLVRPFAQLRAAGKVRHSLQTNATLITREWCDFFREEGFKVGVSIDGAAHLNASRVNWAGHAGRTS